MYECKGSKSAKIGVKYDLMIEKIQIWITKWFPTDELRCIAGNIEQVRCHPFSEPLRQWACVKNRLTVMVFYISIFQQFQWPFDHFNHSKGYIWSNYWSIQFRWYDSWSFSSWMLRILKESDLFSAKSPTSTNSCEQSVIPSKLLGSISLRLSDRFISQMLFLKEVNLLICKMSLGAFA